MVPTFRVKIFSSDKRPLLLKYPLFSKRIVIVIGRQISE